MSSFYSAEELKAIGFASVGEDVSVSRLAAIYSPQKISLGNHVRIDDFVFLSGGAGVEIGDYVHVAVHASLYGKFGIKIGNYVNISGKVTIFSNSDDYSGEYMTGPLLGDEFIHDIGGPVVLEDHVIIGAGSLVLPNVVLAEGTAVGAMSLIKKSTEPFSMYAGIPARKIKERSRRLKVLEKQFLNQQSAISNQQSAISNQQSAISNLFNYSTFFDVRPLLHERRRAA